MYSQYKIWELTCDISFRSGDRPPCIQNIVSSTKAAENKINKLSHKENWREHQIKFYDHPYFKLFIEWLMKSLPVL